MKIQPIFDKIVPLNMAALPMYGLAQFSMESVVAYAILVAYLAMAGLVGSLLVALYP